MASGAGHQVMAKAQAYVIEGYWFVADIDLAKFFDVCHERTEGGAMLCER
jgi:hypothetical protein